MSPCTISNCIGCHGFPCEDVNHDLYCLPAVTLDPAAIRLVMISEAAAQDPADNYYTGENAAYVQTTLQAFQVAGVQVTCIEDLLAIGVYLTPAVKCGKTGYGIKAATVKTCTAILEAELNLFHNVQAYLLMGDVAIKAVNYISKRQTGERAIPAGATYKIRGGKFVFNGKPAFPSYLQVGPSFGIEKDKQRMIAEDIGRAMALI